MKALSSFLLLFTLLQLSACATSSALDKSHSQYDLAFVGTRVNVAALREDEAQLAIYQDKGWSAPEYPLLDLPFSFAADVVLFPFVWVWPML